MLPGLRILQPIIVDGPQRLPPVQIKMPAPYIPSQLTKKLALQRDLQIIVPVAAHAQPPLAALPP